MFDFIGDFLNSAADKVAKVAYLPYGVTRSAVDLGSGLAKDYFAGDADPLKAPASPPPPPDINDEAVQRAAMLQRRRLVIGQGLGSTFLSGPLGDPSNSGTSSLGS